jgi:hypothetical protein
MAEKSQAKAKPKAGAKPAKGKGKGKGGGNAFSWLVLAGLAAGLAWVVWPFFGPPPAAPVSPQKQATQQLRQITTQNPEAEVFNPEGKEAEGDAVKKK